jgi:RNA methyltransferase, TrmH family
VALDELYFSRDWFLGENEPALLAEAEAAGAKLFELSKDAFAKVAYRERPGRDPRRRAAVDGGRSPTSPLPADPVHPRRRGDREAGQPRHHPRSADAAGCDAVIVCDPVTDLFNPNVVRASTGVLFSVPCVVEEGAVLAWLRGRGIRTVATTPAAGSSTRTRTCGARLPSSWAASSTA